MFYFTLNRERLFVHFRIICINIGGEALRSVLVYTTKVFNQALPTF